MNNLKKLLKTPLSKPLSRGLAVFIIVVSFIGFADATFLTIEHYQNRIPPCTTEGCEIVLTSAYSEIAGIPVALIGAIYYFLILVFSIAYIDTKKDIFLKYAFLLSTLGLLASIYFFILQAFIIGAYCQYCIVSGITTTILFITGLYIFFFRK